MIFTPTRLDGLMLVTTEPHVDARGHFARAYCAREFADHGLASVIAQASTSFNHVRGTLRGLHLQRPPHAETKLVRCIRGAIFDVAVDVRPDSPTCCQWQGFELTPENAAALVIPPGFAHGFQTLAPETEVLYLISAFHAPEAAAGFRYDDPAFAIGWPLPVASIGPRDLTWPRFAAAAPV